MFSARTATFLNDVAAAEDGTIYVTDSGAGMVHRILPDGSLEQVGQVKSANGIQVRGETILVAGGGKPLVPCAKLSTNQNPRALTSVPRCAFDVTQGASTITTVPPTELGIAELSTLELTDASGMV